MANDYTPQQIEEILQMFFDVAGTRQYIGARYVPIFGRGRGTAVDWDNSDAYEPLSIVYYQGDTYTSRRYVPAGISIDDQDYWVITGRYNAQVEQYRQEVLSFDDRITANTEAIENVDDTCVPWPNNLQYPKYGTDGQILRTLGNGGTQWVDQQLPSEELMRDAVSDWLDENPIAGIYPEVIASVVTNSNYATLLPDLDTVTGSKIFRLFMSGTTVPAHAPIAKWPETTSVAIFMQIAGNNTANPYQVLFTTEVSYMRNYIGGGWNNWLTLNGYQITQPSLVMPESDYMTIIPSLDNIAKNTVYVLSFTGNETNYPTNFPTAAIPSSPSTAIVYTSNYHSNLTTANTGVTQMVMAANGIWYRFKKNVGWSDWAQIASYVDENTSFVVNRVEGSPLNIYVNSFSEYLPSMDDAAKNTLYRYTVLGTESSSADFPTNFPMQAITGQRDYVLIYTTNYPGTNKAAASQWVITSKGIWRRAYASSAWGAWSKIGGDVYRRRMKVGASQDAEYSSFSEAVIAAYLEGNVDVLVEPGTYDLKTELETIYGSDYFTNLSGSSPYWQGLPFGNGMHIIGSAGVKLTADLSSVTNPLAWLHWSMLMNQLEENKETTNIVENIKFDATCLRYCIHLDKGDSDIDSTYIVRNCEFYNDETDNTEKDNMYCVGMGQSVNTTYIVQDCYFVGVPPASPRDTALLFLHNTDAASPNNSCIMRDNYLEGDGTIRINLHGSSTNKCRVQITNNSLGSAIIDNVNTDNMMVLKWNNEVRGS